MITNKAKLSGRRLQRQRVADENIWRSRVSGYFLRTKKTILKALNERDPQEVIYSLPLLIPREPLYDLYLTLYSQLGLKYYNAVKGGLQKSGVYDFTLKQDAPEAWMEMVRAYINTEIAQRITGVNYVSIDVTKKAIQEAIQEALDNGYGVEKTKKLIESRVDAKWIAMRKNRARVIAKTEMGTTMNWASYQGAIDTGLIITKAWLSYKDKRTRHTSQADHLNMSSSDYIPVNDKFWVTSEYMDYPCQASASAANTISCRCTLIYQSELPPNF